MPGHEENRRAMAERLARFVYRKFLETVADADEELIQSTCLSAGENHIASAATWAQVLEILKNADKTKPQGPNIWKIDGDRALR